MAPRKRRSEEIVDENKIKIRKLDTITFRDMESNIKNWKLNVRIIHKSEVKNYPNCKLFTMDLLDSTAQFKCTVFNSNVAKFYDLLNVGEQYLIANFSITTPNPKFNVYNNIIEIQLNQDTVIENVDEDEGNSQIPTSCYNFKTLEEIKLLEKGKFTDLCGIVNNVGDEEEVVDKNGKPLFKKKTFTINDMDNNKIDISLWNDNISKLSVKINDIFIIKCGKVQKFDSKTYISVVKDTQIKINDLTIPEAIWMPT
ncbi:replication protein A 70 kDa DNA-binding subunit-like isoform X2 [Leptopilina heterotoma]|uniref:replication protein A 70 kDa DNA-binding subunit-like isoform X2 n=1 Tax=Leptopilina heterotoma TaxID=63436 RepID=UPI001CA9FE84|nr:replication protein A 70 kDa DNA-binding subunit-like isoform X2 [Leptopilina heterotoma]XP_043479895.1 replication protein A 70 kDa DNA-binding subunit-like isoform X2 [Leptopilina heterotoma]